MITYAIQLVLFSFGFWLIYYFLLRKETFFNANRMYLLLIPIVAAIVPLISLDFLQITSSESVFAQKSEQLLQGIYISKESLAGETNAGKLISLNGILIGVYGLGVGLSLLLFLRRFIKLLQLKNIGVVEYYDETNLIILPNRKDAFTFLNHIFIGAEIPETEKQTIVAHERVHYAEKHSWDLLYFEILKILFWFNPFMYVFQKYISEIHEFIADKRTVEIQDKTDYAEVLLNTAFGTQQLSFVNSFFINNSLKSRIMMLHKSKSSRLSKFKYLLSIPLVLLMLTYVSCVKHDTFRDADAVNSIEETPPKPPTPPNVEDQITAIVPFSVLSKPPVFPEAGNFGGLEEARSDFQQRINQHVLEHFSKDLVDESLEEIRISAQFEIGEDGRISEVKASSSQDVFEEEAIRVIELLPRMKPGEMKNRPVRTIYNLPIILQAK